MEFLLYALYVGLGALIVTGALTYLVIAIHEITQK